MRTSYFGMGSFFVCEKMKVCGDQSDLKGYPWSFKTVGGELEVVWVKWVYRGISGFEDR